MKEKIIVLRVVFVTCFSMEGPDLHILGGYLYLFHYF